LAGRVVVRVFGASTGAAPVLFFPFASVRTGFVVVFAAAVGDALPGARLGDVDGRRGVAAVACHIRVADGAARHLVRGRAVGPEVEVEGDRAARVGGGPRERRRVGQVGVGGAECRGRAGVGDDGGAVGRDYGVLVVVVGRGR